MIFMYDTTAKCNVGLAKSLDSRKCIDAIFLDFQKAFDSAP